MTWVCDNHPNMYAAEEMNGLDGKRLDLDELCRAGKTIMQTKKEQEMVTLKWRVCTASPSVDGDIKKHKRIATT